MKNLIITISIAFISTITMAENAPFEMAMGKTLQKYATCQTHDDYQSIANNFAVIAKAEQKEWLPLYYQAQCYIIMSFMEEESIKKDEILIPAEELIESMIKLVPNESEVYVLQAMYYSAKLVVNPQERGQKYGALSNQSLQKALALKPNNPRAKYMQIQNDLGTAAFFNQDLNPIYTRAQKVLEEWDEVKPESSIHPNWGKEQLMGLIANSK